MKIDIIIVYVPRYVRGHEKNFVPPITGIHLAALTPAAHTVRVIHQQVEPVNLETDAAVIALSFFSGFAPEAYRLSAEFRRRGKIVVAGGPHVTFNAAEAMRFCDAVVVGEAESVWGVLLQDLEAGSLKPYYLGQPQGLQGLPMPRYDLLPRQFFVPRVVQATRGCAFTCSFCSVPLLNPGFRTRAVAEVLRDIQYDRFPHWWQRKIVWFWDDNLTVKRDYAKQLLTAMVPLRKWWLTQASMDIVRDPDLLELMRRSGCIGIFFGIESFSEKSLGDAHKPQNKSAAYRAQIQSLHDRGICVMAGLISGFDSDRPATIKAMARQLYEAGVDVPFLSVLTPFPGTPVYQKYEAEGRILPERGWEFYNGYNVAFQPKQMTPAELLAAHRELWREAFSPGYSLKRIVRGLFTLRWGAFLMCACMNLFYCIKAMRGNLPRAFEHDNPYRNRRREYAATSPGRPRQECAPPAARNFSPEKIEVTL
jgi:radical SAM superfamily enzyme YgiQ (UPF0313 family)